jgi:predicted RNase H-like HicB family nuclease
MKFGITLQRGEDGSWWVQVPELPGCFSWGETRADAARNAREAIEGHIEALQAVGEDAPCDPRGPISVEVVEVADSL